MCHTVYNNLLKGERSFPSQLIPFTSDWKLLSEPTPGRVWALHGGDGIEMTVLDYGTCCEVTLYVLNVSNLQDVAGDVALL